MSRVLMALVLAAVAGVSQAATFALIPQVGLAGYGATVQWGFTPYLAASAGYTGLDYSIKDVKTDDATYNGDLSLKNPQLFLNWAPFGGHFRVSAGVINQQSTFDLVATKTSDPRVKSVTIDASFTKNIAPALTLGWESSILATGVGYHLSVGAMYAGKPDVKADIRCNSGTTDDTCFGLERDEERKLKEELEKYTVLPILQAGLIYRL